MEAKSAENIKSRRKDEFGNEFIVENPSREDRTFNTDAPDSMAMMMGYIDWLAEQGCHKESELMMLEWSVKIGQLAPTKDARDRIQELRKEFEIKDKKHVNKQVDAPRGRKQTLTLFLEEPIGFWYTKATINVLHMEHFINELHAQPLMSLLLACNGTTSPALVSKYLKYSWLKKCTKLEFNNLDIGFVEMRTLFNQPEIVVVPQEIIITGRLKQLPTVPQLQLLPVVCPALKHLWRIDYQGAKYDYRFSLEEQPKW